MLNETDIELRNEGVNEILGTPPAWLIRWGISIVGLVVLLLLFLSFILKYPDVIVARVTITTEQLPVSVVARSNGKISHLFVSENQMVNASKILAVMDNAADYQDVLSTKEELTPFHQFLLTQDSVVTINFNKELNLGDIQPSYSNLFKAFQEYKLFIERNLYDEKILQTRQQVYAHQNLHTTLDSQRNILIQKFILAENKYNVDKDLAERNIISARAFEATEESYLDEKYKLEAFKVDMINATIKIQDLHNELIELQQKFEEERSRYLEQLKQTSLNFTAEMAKWEDTYLLRSPINGTISFFKFWSDNQFVKSGDEVMVVIPDTREMYGYAYVPISGFGKIQRNQRVRIWFESFPHDEFGSVIGIVEATSNITRDDSYLVKINLPVGLRTDYQKTLKFTQNMQGEAHIVTEDLRLIERIVYQFRSLYQW